MKPEIFLFSRTPAADYRYLFPLPSARSDAVNAFVQARLADMQRGQADGTVHFFLSDTDAILLRAVESGSQDNYGRAILSLEGLYCPARDVRPFWLCLPHLVPGFWRATSLYPLLVRDGQTAPLPAARLLDACAQYSARLPQTKAMQRAIFAADAPVSFTFDADGLHLSQQPSTRGRTRWQPAQTRRCDIHLTFDRRAKTAHLTAHSRGAAPFAVARSADIAREADGWPFDALTAAADALERELDARGWQYAPEKGGNP
ncbi:MAG TPA: hypothetical protein IAA32_06480 [Candidatus Butyricicoccus stercorigallinarum]|nr:hypothetical protein [Candidatus Butyricicoccus stercorigallinarum]